METGEVATHTISLSQQPVSPVMTPRAPSTLVSQLTMPHQSFTVGTALPQLAPTASSSSMTCPMESPLQEELVTDEEWKDESGGGGEALTGEGTITVCKDGIEYTEKIRTGRMDVFTDYTMASPYNGINLDVVELYAGGSTTAVALVLEGYGLKRLRSSEFNQKQRIIATHNLQTLHRLFPERVSQEIVDKMHKTEQDVRQLSSDDISGADIVSAGFPCQDMSKANRKRKGFRGGRSGQYYALEKLLKRLVRLEPSVTILLENVDFSDTFPEDFKRVNAAWGYGTVRDAADSSFQHRLRIWWGYNIKIKRSVKKPGLNLQEILEPENEPRKAQYTDKAPFSVYNTKDQPQLKFVTQLTKDDTWNVRSGDAMVLRSETGGLVRPWTCELSRGAGWWDCFIAAAPVDAEDRVFCLGNSQDLNELRDILRSWSPCKAHTVEMSRAERNEAFVDKKLGAPDTSTTTITQSEAHTAEKGVEQPGTLQEADTFSTALNRHETGEMKLEQSEDSFLCENPFALLADMAEEEEDMNSDYMQFTPDCLKGAAGEMLYRAAAEVRRRFPKKGFSKRQPTHPSDCVTAADWKYLLAYKLPIIMHIPVPKIMSCKAKAEWNCISLQRLRFQGSKENYVVIRDAANQRRVLVLHVPPKGMSEGAQQAHAERQATFHDNAEGILEKGIRIKFNKWKSSGPVCSCSWTGWRRVRS